MKEDRKYIAVGTDEKGQIWSGHFGMAPQYYIYDHSGTLIEKRTNPYGAGGGEKHTHHDDPKLIITLLSDCGVFIARRVGEKSKQKLVNQWGIEVVLTQARDPKEAMQEYIKDHNNSAES